MNLPQRPLGSSHVMITKTGFGAWAIGGGGWAFGWGPQDDAVSLATMRHALELGVNWTDTGRSVRARSFRGSGRPPAVRTAAIRSPNGLHQVWIDLGSQQSDSRAATSAQAGFYSAGMRRFVAAVGRGTH